MKKLAISALLLMVSSTAPAAAVSISEETISFETHDGLTLEGYISHPSDDAGPFPGVLLITGSGLHDADVTVRGGYGVRGVQRIYKRLAHDFSRQGFIVFRYNKRGASFHHANDDPALLLAADHDDLLEDARNALGALIDHRLTAATNLTVVGNSEGVLLALRLGVQHREIDLLVLIGSPAYRFERSMRYQSVDRYLYFSHEAGDANGDGSLTLEELDRIGGNHGRGSFHVSSIQGLLFDFEQRPDGSQGVVDFHPDIDVDGDGQVDIEGELKPVLAAAMRREANALKSGERGRYGQSFFEFKAPLKFVHRVHGKILLAQGELDIVTPLGETLALIEKLDRHGRPWDAILFPKLGHTLSKSRDFYKGDGGLTILDNPTQNAPKKSARREIIRKAKEMLGWAE